MSAEQAQRKLAAILHADVVGYSRLMAEDDAATDPDFREPWLDGLRKAGLPE